METSDHTRPQGRRAAPLTRKEVREERMAEERRLAASVATVAMPVVKQESRRMRRLREQSVPLEDAAAVRILPSAATPRIKARATAPAAPAKLTVVPAPIVAPVSAPEAESPEAPPARTPEAETPQPESAEPAAAPRFRFDVGSIPLAPHSAYLPLAAPVVPSREREDLVALSAAASESIGRILRRSLSVSLAAASVAGLVLTAAIPALAPLKGGDRTQASAIQQLSLRNTAGSDLTADVVEGVDGTEVAADAATIAADTYVNNPNGIVQYPFSRGVPLTDPFGYRTEPVAQFHDGQDFAAGYGAAIRSIAGGVVLESGSTTDGCGTGMKISHKIEGLDVTSRYCHMQEGSTLVDVGAEVQIGQMIGRVGATGMSFGPHLHFVIEVAGEAVEPMAFLAKYNAITR